MHPRPWTIAAAAVAGASLMLAALGVLIIPASGAEPHRSSAISVIGLQASNTQSDDATPNDQTDAPVAATLDSHQAKGVLGTAVRSATDEDMGRIIDIVVDRAGIPRAAVIDFGGFLGVGSRKVAIDWNAIRFNGRDGITLDLTRDQVKAAPQYQDGKPIVILGAAAEFVRSRVTERTTEP